MVPFVAMILLWVTLKEAPVPLSSPSAASSLRHLPFFSMRDVDVNEWVVKKDHVDIAGGDIRNKACICIACDEPIRCNTVVN